MMRASKKTEAFARACVFILRVCLWRERERERGERERVLLVLMCFLLFFLSDFFPKTHLRGESKVRERNRERERERE